MSDPSLSRRDRVFHQGVTRLEVLRSSQLICLPLHFLYLTALRVYLRARVNKRGRSENRSRDSSQNPWINVHALTLGVGEKLRNETFNLPELAKRILGIEFLREIFVGGKRIWKPGSHGELLNQESRKKSRCRENLGTINLW